MKIYKVTLGNTKVEIFQDIDGGFIRPDFVKELESKGTALKPANEPIVVARKPLSEKTIVSNVLKWGTGGINIDDCRVPLNGEKRPTGSAKRVYRSNQYTEDKIYGDNKQTPIQGRFPANVILDEKAGKMLDEQSGQLKSGTLTGKEPSNTTKDIYGKFSKRSLKTVGDKGGASRFFYCAKASKSERNAGLNKSFINIEVMLNTVGINCKEKSSTKEVRLATLQVDMDRFLLKVTDEYGIQKQNGMKWNTTIFGKNIMDQFQKEIVSITKTKTNSITTFQISNWLMHFIIKEYMVDVKRSMVYGGSHVENATQLNQLINIHSQYFIKMGLILLLIQTILKSSKKT